MKIAIQTLGLSILANITFLVLLLLTRDFLLNEIIEYFSEIRGTSHYEGETKAFEFFSIFREIIIPITSIICLVASFIIIKSFKARNSQV